VVSRRSLLTALALTALLAPPAAAHPFGPPPQARVSADGRRVSVEWTSATDDAIALGVQVGVLPVGSLEAFQEGAAQVAPAAADVAALSTSPALASYLLDRILVVQDGAACDGTVQPIADFVADGARVVYDCPQPVEQVELTITMLHDIHEAYRTFAVAEGAAEPRQAVFTVADPAQDWRFRDAEQRAPGPLRGLLVPAGILAGLGLAAAAVRTVRARGR
jgi:hypothetical protein